MPNDHPLLRPYQFEANTAVEQAIADRKRQMLLAMATGTGKTYTMVNQVYRLMKSGVAKRILFLVDRRALAAQAVRAFASFEAEPGLKFDKIYEVYSQRFQRDDLEEDDKFDPKVLPGSYLLDPKPGHAFVYVCTIQRMTIDLLGREAILDGDESIDEERPNSTFRFTPSTWLSLMNAIGAIPAMSLPSGGRHWTISTLSGSVSRRRPPPIQRLTLGTWFTATNTSGRCAKAIW